MRIAVIGAGALGLYYGALLQRAGEDVRFLLRRDFEAVSRGGLTVTSPAGDFHLDSVRGFRTTAEMGEADLVLVGLKTFSNDRLAELIAPVVGKGTAILTLQNGLGNEELLADAFGGERILGGIAFLCSNRGEPGTVHHLGQGAVRLGEWIGPLSDRGERIAALFCRAGIPCQAVSDLRRARWEKLVWNIPFNGLCTLTGKDVTTLLAHPPSRELVRGLMAEVIAGANAQPLDSPIDAEAFISRMVALSEPMTGYRPSMMIDRAEERPLELDAIYTLPLRRAAEKGVEMARVRMLHTLLDLGEVPSS